MSHKKGVQLGVLCAILIAVVWYERNKIPFLRDQVSASSPGKNSSANSAEQSIKIPVPVPPPPEVTDAELFPLKPGKTLPLSKVPEPATRDRAPVLFFAPLIGSSNPVTTPVVAMDMFLRRQLHRQRTDHLAINVIGVSTMDLPYRRENGTGSRFGHSPEEYFHDAQAIGADVFIYGRFVDDGQNLSLQLASSDLHTSRTDTFTAEGSSSSFADFARDCLRGCARLAGISEKDIADNRLDQDLPNNEVWQALSSSGHGYTIANAADVATGNPNCYIATFAALNQRFDPAQTQPLMAHFPDDKHLLAVKAYAMYEAGKPYAAFLIDSELLRQFPDWLELADDLGDITISAFPQMVDAGAAPPAYSAAADALEAYARRHPSDWNAKWTASRVIGDLATYVRGTRTVEYIPEQAMTQFHGLAKRSATLLDEAAAQRPDCPELLRAQLAHHFDNQDSNYQWQIAQIEKIHKIDPSNVQAELTTAYSHSVGWDDPKNYLPIIEMAMNNHRNDARAMGLIAQSIVQDISRMVAFHAVADYDELINGPEGELLDKCVTEARAGGITFGLGIEKLLQRRYELRGETHKIATQETQMAGNWQQYHQIASDAYDRSDWPVTLQYAKAALEHSAGDDERENEYYWVVKSLWRMKRYDESLEMAEKQIAEFPNKQAGHYMFAIIALEKNDRLEEAYQHAKRAVEISSTNDGANKTYETLKQKLHKP